MRFQNKVKIFLKFILPQHSRFSSRLPYDRDVSCSPFFCPFACFFFQKIRSPFYLSIDNIFLALKYKIHCQAKNSNRMKTTISKPASEDLFKIVEKTINKIKGTNIKVKTQSPKRYILLLIGCCGK